MRRIKKGIAVALSLVLALSLTACGTKKSAEKNDKLVIAYQNGLSYTPLLVMKEKKLIEKHYGKDVNVDWKLLESGAAISEGINSRFNRHWCPLEHQLQLTELCQRHRTRFVQVWQQFLAESRLMTVALRL